MAESLRRLWRPGDQNLLVVTRHPSLRQYLLEQGIIPPDAPVMEHVTVADVRGKHVIGKVTTMLAAEALTVTEVPLRLEASDRGRGELSLVRLRETAMAPRVFEVHRIA